MFWGSDLTRLPCSYREAVTMWTEEIPWLSAQDKEWTWAALYANGGVETTLAANHGG